MPFDKSPLGQTIKHLTERFNQLIDDLLSVVAGKGASQIGIEDSAGRYTATNVEGAVSEIAGAGRTTETVKGNKDLIDAHASTTTGIHGVGTSTVESAAGAQTKVDTHSGVTTGVHGVGSSTVESATGAQTKVNTHSGATTGVHGVGAGTVAKVGDIAVDTNLSATAQDAITKRHSQNTDTALATNKVTVTAAGIVSIPQQSSIKVKGTTGQTIPSNSATIVQYNTVEWDTHNEWNTSTYRFTATTGGKYLAVASVESTTVDWSASDVVSLYLYKNGTLHTNMDHRRIDATVTTNKTGQGCAVFTLSPNDYADIRVVIIRTASTTLTTSQTYNHLSIHKIS